MQALVDLFMGVLTLLAAAALSQFGVDLQRSPPQDREVRRTVACDDAAHTAGQAPKRVQALAPPSAPLAATSV